MDATALYRLITWLSPSFPVGAYSYSHGLEYAVEVGLVPGATALEGWLTEIIQEGSGRVDAVLFCAAYRAVEGVERRGGLVPYPSMGEGQDGGDTPYPNPLPQGEREPSLALQGQAPTLLQVVETAAAMRGTAELAMESLAQGRAFLDTVLSARCCPDLEIWAEDLKRMEMAIAYPVAVAVVCAVNEIPLETALSAYLHAFAANLVSAGVRLIPLGQTDGQKVIAALEESVITAAQEALKCQWADLGSATPMVDWTSMQHETQYTRLFRS